MAKRLVPRSAWRSFPSGPGRMPGEATVPTWLPGLLRSARRAGGGARRTPPGWRPEQRHCRTPSVGGVVRPRCRDASLHGRSSADGGSPARTSLECPDWRGKRGATCTAGSRDEPAVSLKTAAPAAHHIGTRVAFTPSLVGHGAVAAMTACKHDEAWPFRIAAALPVAYRGKPTETSPPRPDSSASYGRHEVMADIIPLQCVSVRGEVHGTPAMARRALAQVL